MRIGIRRHSQGSIEIRISVETDIYVRTIEYIFYIAKFITTQALLFWNWFDWDKLSHDFYLSTYKYEHLNAVSVNLYSPTFADPYCYLFRDYWHKWPSKEQYAPRLGTTALEIELKVSQAWQWNEILAINALDLAVINQ